MAKTVEAAEKSAAGERSERAQWARARMELLNEFNSEEKRLDEVMRANDVLLYVTHKHFASEAVIPPVKVAVRVRARVTFCI